MGIKKDPKLNSIVKVIIISKEKSDEGKIPCITFFTLYDRIDDTAEHTGNDHDMYGAGFVFSHQEDGYCKEKDGGIIDLA